MVFSGRDTDGVRDADIYQRASKLGFAGECIADNVAGAGGDTTVLSPLRWPVQWNKGKTA
jgi:hypothetical protein